MFSLRRVSIAGKLSGILIGIKTSNNWVLGGNKNKKPLLKNKKRPGIVRSSPLIFQNFISAGIGTIPLWLVVEVSQGLSLHLSG
jgi:hypothetical protein